MRKADKNDDIPAEIDFSGGVRGSITSDLAPTRHWCFWNRMSARRFRMQRR